MAGAALLICIAAAFPQAQEPAPSEARSWVDHLFDAERALHDGRLVDALEHLNEVPEENPALHYGMACVVARMGHPDAHVLLHLERAVEHGWSDAAVARWQPAFARLEFDPQFVSVLEEMERAARLSFVGHVGLPSEFADARDWPEAPTLASLESDRALLERFSFDVPPCAFRSSPDGTRVAVAFGVQRDSQEPFEARPLVADTQLSIGGEVRVLDLGSGEELWRKRTVLDPTLVQRQHPAALHWSADGQRLAAEFTYQTGVVVWDAGTGDPLVESWPLYGGSRRIAWVDSHRLLVQDEPAILFDASGEARRSQWLYLAQRQGENPDAGPLGSVRVLASGHVDAPRGSTLLRYSGHEASRPRILTTQLDVAYRLLDPFVVRAVDAGVAVAPALVADPRDRSSVPPQAAVTLYDAHDALSRLEASWAAAAEEQQRAAHARADAALDAWISGERSRAVEEWTRLRLELRGRAEPWDVGLASLRLEFVEGGATGRVLSRRWSHGPDEESTRVRVAQRFPVRELGQGRFRTTVRFVDLAMHPYPARISVDIDAAFDVSGRLLPHSARLGLAPAAPMGYAIEASARGTRLDGLVAINSDPSRWRAGALGRVRGRSDPVARAIRAWVTLRQTLRPLEHSVHFVGAQSKNAPLGLVQPPGACRWVLEEDIVGGRALMERLEPTWRIFVHGDRDLALWVAQPTADEKRPAVIALHGDGFDEGWFGHLAGGGALFTEGPERGVVVAAPRTQGIADHPGALESLIDDLVTICNVDRERVYLLGHGTGGELAKRLFDPEMVAGAACLAPDSFDGPADTLYVVGEQQVLPPATDAEATIVRVPGAGRVLGLERLIAAALEQWGLR